ncbi:acyltransferase family protein [Pediococcus siamensis]|uniref:acyltransferase family protein n=1 Tax=Pediococcus siamensis TaxID=381829 RepID=UPI00399F15D1
MDFEKLIAFGKAGRKKGSPLKNTLGTASAKQAKRLKHSRYIAGFDGLRTLALLGVILYHLLPYDMKGGYLGVPIFFALSGYLITDLFVQEWDQNGSIKVLSFYKRRLKRIYPTLVTVLVASTAYMTVFAQDLLGHIKSIVWTNLLFVYNWWQIGHGQSYFDRYNGESPFTHLWYLSVLGQYYFIWPIVMIALLIVFKNRGHILGVFNGLAIVSALLMLILYDPANTNRVYYGTDTRMTPYLLGAALAFFWPTTHLNPHLKRNGRVVLNTLGTLSLIFIVWMGIKMSGTGSFVYRGGMLLFSLFAVILIAVIAHPGTKFGDRLFSNPLFAWIGKRSYGIYLYQFPVMIFYEKAVVNIAAHPLLNALIEAVIIVVISDLSYRFIETPLAHFNYGQLIGVGREFFKRDSVYGKKRYWLIPIVLIFVLAGVGIANGSNQGNRPSALQLNISKNKKKSSAQNAKALQAQKQARQKKKQRAAELARIKKEKAIKLTSTEQKIKTKYNLEPSEVKLAQKMSVTGIGDSIMADTSDDLQEVFPNAYISAKVGRQVWQATSLLKQLATQGNLSDNVLINLGTNGAFTQQQLKTIVSIVGTKREIFWVNVHVPTKNWESQVNNTIRTAAKQYKNVHIVDWHGASLNQPNWFYGDHVHPNITGSKAYTALITKAVVKYGKTN